MYQENTHQEVGMPVEFTAHNIRLDDGTYTKPDAPYPMESLPWLVSAQRILETVFPGDKQGLRLADLGCLEGGFAVEFARMGFQVLGLDVREANIRACRYVKTHTNLPNLEFVQDDAWNIAKYGTFDAVFCCGLLYHLDSPKRFLEILSTITTKLLIVQTHFSTETSGLRDPLPRALKRLLPAFLRGPATSRHIHRLSRLCEHESVRGRWYDEFDSDEAFRRRPDTRWAAWENRRSFWMQREYLLQTIWNVGFDLVMEQYDSLSPEIAGAMTHGYYKTENRGTFLGIKTQGPGRHSPPNRLPGAGD
jgi:hypothetical protein